MQQRGGAGERGTAEWGTPPGDASRLDLWGSHRSGGESGPAGTPPQREQSMPLMARMPGWIRMREEVPLRGAGPVAAQPPRVGFTANPETAKQYLADWEVYAHHCRQQGGIPLTIDLAMQAQYDTPTHAQLRSRFRAVLRLLASGEQSRGNAFPPVGKDWVAPLADVHYVAVWVWTASQASQSRSLSELRRVLDEAPPPSREGGYAAIVGDQGVVYAHLERVYPGVDVESLKSAQQIMVRDALIRRVGAEPARHLLQAACMQHDMGDAPLRDYRGALEAYGGVLITLLGTVGRPGTSGDDGAARDRMGARGPRAPAYETRRPPWADGRASATPGVRRDGAPPRRDGAPVRAYAVRVGRGDYVDAEDVAGEWDGADETTYDDVDVGASEYSHHDDRVYDHDDDEGGDTAPLTVMKVALGQRDHRRGGAMGARPQRAAGGAAATRGWGRQRRRAPSACSWSGRISRRTKAVWCRG